MMWGYGYDWSWMPWMMVLASIFWLGLLGLMIWAIIRLFQRHDNITPLQQRQSAFDVLRERYARGEIDADTFEQMRSRLQQRDASQPLQYLK